MRPVLKACVLLTLGVLLASQCITGSGRPSAWGAGTGSSSGEAVSPVKTFQLHQAGEYPLGVTADAAGNVWFAEDNSDQIVEFAPGNSSFHDFQIPTHPHLAWIWFLVFVGGVLWFADESQHLLWSFSPVTHSFANFSAGAALPFSIAYDAGRGRMWFTSLVTNQVGYFQLEGGTAQLGRLVNISAPSPGAGPSDLVLDGSGNLYVTETFQAKIVELSGTDLSVLRTWQLPTGSEPVGLSLDQARGRLWFTNHASSYFGYVDLGPGGGYREYPTSLLFQNGTYWVTLPYWITISPDGSVWFDEHAGNRIARFDPASLQLTELTIPTENSAPLRLAVDGQRGIVWFTEFAGNALGEVAANSSEAQSVSVSIPSAVLDPSTSFTAAGGPGTSLPPTFSFTGTVTGEGAPSFGSSSNPSDGGYEATIREEAAGPGNYTAGVCFEYQVANQCAYVLLTVPAPASAAPLLDAIYLALAAVGVAIAYGLRREYLSKRAGASSAPGPSS